MNRDQLDQLATSVLDAAFEVHRALGPGLLENAYEMALCHELAIRGIQFERQKELPVIYKGVRLDCGYRLDVIVENEIVLELKACEQLTPIHEATLLNYLILSNRSLGYLLNFNVRLLKTASNAGSTTCPNSPKPPNPRRARRARRGSFSHESLPQLAR